MTKKRKLAIGGVVAGALSLLLVWAIPAYAQGGGQTPPAPTDQDWQAMHDACSNGDVQGMNDAMQRVHGSNGGGMMGGNGSGMMGGYGPTQGTQPRSNPGIQGTQGTKGTRAQYRSGNASDRSVGGGMMGGYGGGGMMGGYGQGAGGMMGGYGSGPGGMMGGYGPGSGRTIEGTGPAANWGGMMGGLGNVLGGMMGGFGGGGMMGW